jgi:hypothetical protein
MLGMQTELELESREAARDLEAESEAQLLVRGSRYHIMQRVDSRDGLRKYFLFGPTGLVCKTIRPRKLLEVVRKCLLRSTSEPR